MTKQKIIYLGQILLILAEVSLISFLSYAVDHFFPTKTARYISFDLFYCLPVIQTARLSAIHAARRSDTQNTTFIGIAIALVWCVTETEFSGWDFPIYAFLLNTFTRSIVFIVIGRVIVHLWREREYARKDMLTGLANRVELMERLTAEQVRSERTGFPYSLLFIDIDHFKALNDAYGHLTGDEALKMLADVLRQSTRKVDVSARLGGDEFVLLLPDTDEQSCDILVRRIEASAQRVFEGQFGTISISIGRATARGKTHSADWVLHLADENMYQVKHMKQQMMSGVHV